MNDIKNKIINYLLKHCHVYTTPIYTMIQKVGVEAMRSYLESYEKSIDK